MLAALSLDDLGIHHLPAVVEPRSGSGTRGKTRLTGVDQELARLPDETLANLSGLVDQAEEEVAGEGVEFLGELLERLAKIEEDTRRELRGIQKTRETARQVRKLLQELPRSAPGRRELLEGIERPLSRMDRWVEAAEILIPAYRDTRWKLMALRADYEDPGDAPVFDDPEQLDRYLAGS